MLTSSHIFSGVIYSTFVSYVYVLMGRILGLVLFVPHCNLTVSLVQHCFIINGPLYGVSFFNAELLLSVVLSMIF